MLPRWTRLSRKRVISTKFRDIYHDQFRLPNGFEGEYLFIAKAHSAMIIPVRDDGKIILLNQYRYLFDRESIEFPSGGAKREPDGEGGWRNVGTPEELARAELAEEAGMAGDLEHVGTYAPLNGDTDEISHVFIARNLHTTEQHMDETEEFETLSMTPDEIDTAIADGRIWDGMSITSWAFARGKIVGKE